MSQMLRRRRVAAVIEDGDVQSSGDEMDTGKTVHTLSMSGRLPHFSPNLKDRISDIDYVLAFTLLTVASMVRFMYLSYIDKVIFDEVC